MQLSVQLQQPYHSYLLLSCALAQQLAPLNAVMYSGNSKTNGLDVIA